MNVESLYYTTRGLIEDWESKAAYMALNKNLIEPLIDWKFISVEKIGSRHIVSLTDEGINALRFLHESR